MLERVWAGLLSSAGGRGDAVERGERRDRDEHSRCRRPLGSGARRSHFSSTCARAGARAASASTSMTSVRAVSRWSGHPSVGAQAPRPVQRRGGARSWRAGGDRLLRAGPTAQPFWLRPEALTKAFGSPGKARRTGGRTTRRPSCATTLRSIARSRPRAVPRVRRRRQLRHPSRRRVPAPREPLRQRHQPRVPIAARGRSPGPDAARTLSRCARSFWGKALAPSPAPPDPTMIAFHERVAKLKQAAGLDRLRSSRSRPDLSSWYPSRDGHRDLPLRRDAARAQRARDSAAARAGEPQAPVTRSGGRARDARRARVRGGYSSLTENSVTG